MKTLIILLFTTVPSLVWGQQQVEASAILQQIHSGLPVAYRDVRITGELDLTRLNNLRQVSEHRYQGQGQDVRVYAESYAAHLALPVVFINCTFSGEVVASRQREDLIYEADFGRAVRFEGCVFEKMATFRHCWFEKEVTFTNCNFFGGADFRHAYFAARPSFYGTIFDGKADFRHTTFYQGASFEAVNFKADADFRHAEFSGPLSFKRTQSARRADFGLAQLNEEGVLVNMAEPAEK
jgi:uncharacterized protein YjbI with pentapeptide repeats